MNRKILLIIAVFLGGLVLMFAGFLLWQNYQTSRFVINAPQNSKIFVKQNSNSFSELGTTTAKYNTNSSSEVYFEARLDGQVSQKSFKPKSHHTETVNLSFQPIINAQLFAKGALTSIFIENGFIYGINPHTNALAAFPIIPSQTTAPNVPLLPYLKQIIWKNSKNFYAVTLGRGTQVVENNTRFEGNQLPYGAIATGRENSILVGNNAYYFSQNTNLNKTVKLSDFIKNSEPNVFADFNFLYAVNTINDISSKEVSNNDDTVIVTPKETNLLIFNQSGQQKYNLNLDIKSKIYKLLSIDQNTLIALTENKLNIIEINTKKVTEKDFSFGVVKDMVLYNNKLLLLGSDGLWQYSIDNNQYTKVAKYPSSQEYVANSLTVLNGSLFFSTSATKEAIKNQSGSDVTNAIYKISF